MRREVLPQVVGAGPADDPPARDDRARDREAGRRDALAHGVHDDVRPVSQRPQERGRRDGAVHDEGDAGLVGDRGDRRDVQDGQRRVARHLAVEEARRSVHQARPLVDVERLAHPPDVDPALAPVPLAEELERAAVALRPDDDVGPPAGAVFREERADRHVDRRHPGAGDDGRRGRPRAVRLEEREGLLEVVDGGVRDPRVAPGGHEVAQGGLEVLAVGEVLGGAQVRGLDDAALVLQGGLGRVDPVDGDRVEAHPAHPHALALLGGRHLLAARDPRREPVARLSCAGRGGRGPLVRRAHRGSGSKRAWKNRRYFGS